MSVLNRLRTGQKTYFSRRLWIFGGLLLGLCALAIVQYRWIEQLGDAQSQREKANLAASLSNLESDFDVEITRVFVAFQFPFASGDYAERYKQWLRHAPYPNLIRGVYMAEAGQTESLPKAVIPGEPAILSTNWQQDLTELQPPITAVSVSGPAQSLLTGLHTFSRGTEGVAFVSRRPDVVIDGNPAFVFPIMSAERGVATRVKTRGGGAKLFWGGAGIMTRGTLIGPARWAVVVLDAEYIRTTFLPRLVKLYFGNTLASDYEILVVNRNNGASSRVVFPAESAPPESQFLHPDARINLFSFRLDCFPPSPPPSKVSAKGNLPSIHLLPGDSVGDSVSEILARKSPVCGPAPVSGNGEGGLWEVLVRHRAGSLDQAVATFRRRNLILSGTALLVLALGISMLVVLTERARALAEMQAEFVLGVSHELRTPLAVIRLAADNLKRGIVENVEQANKYGDIIHARVSDLSNMIEEALALARVQSTPVLQNRARITPQEIVKSAITDNETALRNAGIEVALDIAADLPVLSADGRLLQRCLENLIQNVVKYAASGRWMAIRVNRVYRPEGERVQISVEDRGPGISPVDLPHIFEPFYRGKNREVSQVPGVGLGLTLVKRAVEAHQGSVEVESSEITRFSILLPPCPVRPETQGEGDL